jgi:hypothetical protein
MSALGQKRISAHVRVMSALPQKQTLEVSRATSAFCQKATTSLLSFENLLGAEGFASNPRRFHAQCFRTEAGLPAPSC